MSVHSLYVHVPFCERKCEYCDFVSVGGTAGEAEYVDALRAEIAHLGAALDGPRLDTVFFGGGTPGLIEPLRLAGLLDEVRASFALDSAAEVTLEVNPSSTTPARAAVWRDAGFNRVSIGVQSTEPDILRFLGRVHDADRALGAVADVRTAGFNAVNCDLIYAVPGLDDNRWRRTLDRVVDANPDHISCYELTVEPGTPLHASVRRGTVRIADPEVALRQHWITVDALSAAGLTQYEVSNFARPGQECRHNLVYWRNQFYAAAGVGAHGYLPAPAAGALGLQVPEAHGIRYWHTRKIPRYVAGATDGGWGIEDHEFVDGGTEAIESVMLGLRLREGVVVPARMRVEADALTAAGLLRRDGERISTTRRGEELLNEVVARLAA